MQDTYMGGENQSFEENKIYPHKTLALEVKPPGTNFEDYDPNRINLKINLWNPKIVAFSEESLQPSILTISKDAPLNDLIVRLSEQTMIP